MNAAITRLLETMIMALVVNHLFACFYFMLYKLDVIFFLFILEGSQSKYMGLNTLNIRWELFTLISLFFVSYSKLRF